MTKIIRTDSGNLDFIELVKQLDAYLAEIDGDDHEFYAQYNKTGALKNVVVAYEDEIPIACGATKEFQPGIMEVKRMYTIIPFRGKGIATKVLTELENWGRELSVNKFVLETGKRQPSAIQLYQRSGYKIIPNFGQYVGMENSVCFEKELKP